MIDTWFTSDSHFGHENVLEFEKEHRPFSSLEEMHEVMIERWNSVVKPKDVVYHLGDFAFGRKNIAIAGRLNGRKKLILGNHDNYPSEEYLRYFEKLYGMTYWGKCVLSHMPVHVESLASRCSLNLHGHYHSKRVHVECIFDGTFEVIRREEDKNYFNVSVEQNNLTPFHRDQIEERLKEIE